MYVMTNKRECLKGVSSMTDGAAMLKRREEKAADTGNRQQTGVGGA